MGKRGTRLVMEESGKYCLNIDKGSASLTKSRSSKTSHDHHLLLSSPFKSTTPPSEVHSQCSAVKLASFSILNRVSLQSC